MKQIFYSILLLLFGTSATQAQLKGDWTGTIDHQGAAFVVTFHLTESAGVVQGTMDLPMQGALGIPLTSGAFENNQLTLNIEQGGVKYIGTLDNNKLSGTFSQGDAKMALALEKTVMTKPGDTTLVSTKEQLAALSAIDHGNYKYQVSDYFTTPKLSNFQLSPNGKYISYREKDDKKKNHVMIKEVATGKIHRAIEEKEELIRGIGWINNDRLVYIMDQGGNENYHLYAIDIDGKNNRDLTPFDNVQASIVNLLKEQKDFIIIQMNKDNKQVFEPYKVNIHTGALEKLFTNDDPQNAIDGYDFDKDGNLRGYSKMHNGINSQYFYKITGTDHFELLNTRKWYETFNVITFNYASENPDEAFVVTNLDSDKSRIVLYDLKNKKIIKEIYSNEDYDANLIFLSRKRNWEIDFVGYEGEKVVIKPISETFKKIYKNLEKEFQGYAFSISGRTDLEDQFLIGVQSDKLYGRYYHYDTKSGKTTLLADLMPQLKEEDMAEMRPITFKSRDGLTLHGYITLPKEALNGKKVPLIVNPHGGPQGLRDSWGFNPESQLFASRGYATLQVNFRISGGYGKGFLQAGFKQVGRKAMDDVEDGIQHVIEQGWVDKNNVAIYGASHGGYAVLRGLAKTPHLYKAGVDYVGVSNIFTLMSSIPEYWKPYKEMLYEIWYDLDKEDEAAIAKEVSPIFHVDQIKAPLFVVQGANDPRVKIAEADQIVKALRNKGVDVPYMVKYDEGHGFHKEENKIEFYRAMMGFFKKHLN